MKRFYTLFVILFTCSYWFNVASAQNVVEIVRVPDVNLAAQLRKALGLAPTVRITKQAMAQLTRLDASRDQKDELDFPISDITGLEHATQLEELRLWQHQEIRDISPLAGLTQLKNLSLSENDVSDISPLAGLTQLRDLHLGGNQIRDISPLAGLTQLWNLALYRNQIRDISPLAGLKQLSILRLANNQIRDISPLAGLTQLRDLGFLGLGDNQISDISPLAGLTQLEKLDLVNNRILDVTPLAGLVNLEKLALAGNPIRDASPLANLARLVEVDIEIPHQVRAGGVIPDRHLAGAVRATLHLPNTEPITAQMVRGLRGLIVAHNTQVSSLTGLEHATQLEALTLNRSQISDISPLANLTQLKRLVLGNSQISDISPLTNLTQLTYLTLQGNQISDISPLTNLTQLEFLWLVYNRIRDISPLAGLTQLKQLGLYTNEISDVLPLTRLVNLETLSLGNNPIEDASPLVVLPKLRDVDIEIPPPPVVRLGISNRPSIYWIDEASNTLQRLTDTKVEYVISGIQNATGLAVDTTAEKIYWTEGTGRNVGEVKSANLDGSNIRTLAVLPSVPSGIAVDTVGKKLYWANSRGRIQRANLNGKQIRAVIQNLDYPSNIALDVAGGKLYWTEASGRIRRANLNGKSIETLASAFDSLSGLAISNNKAYWTEVTSESSGKIWRANLNGSNIETLARPRSVPLKVAIDSVGKKLYWTDSDGNIRCANLNGKNIKKVVSGLSTPRYLALGTTATQAPPSLPISNTTLRISPSSVVSPTIGERLELSLNIAGGKDVAGYQATVQFNTTALRYVSGVSGDFLPTGAFFVKPVVKGNLVKLNAASLAGETSGDGTLATLTFQVISVKASTVTLSDVLLSNRAGEGFIPRIKNAQITEPARLKGDVNGDSIVNIQDLVLVASNLSKVGRNIADVNGDRIVNIQDLVLVAGALGNNAAAPSLHPQFFLEMLTAEDVKLWLSHAQQANLTDAISQKGILFLERLLVALIPEETALLPNYPNPFNPETWIPYKLADASNVVITIYDVRGTVVRRLDLGHQREGYYTRRSNAAYWDGRNTFGEPVASGVYFYVLTAGGFSATRKMLIRK